ncbi:MAG: peptidase M19 [Gammaproteobacteria bacterium]|nr:peptidase M19 [Gammaproteobacteria bacterium]
MNAEELHRDAIIIDGLEICNWSRTVFEDMRKGGLTAVNATCVVWQGFRGAMDSIARWKQWFAANDDILLQVHCAADIRRAKAAHKTGIYLGWQNTYGIEDRLEYVRLFKDLGVGCMQLTYNTRNLVGSGCWESKDEGLSDFGYEVIEAMNDARVLVDLSHVGPNTSEQAINHSRQPVAYTHCAPAGLFQHPRNKTDEQLRCIADRGGFVGFATYPPFMAQGPDTTLEHCVDVLDYLVNLVGEDALGIGTDFTQEQDAGFFDYLSLDKGYARRVVPKRPGSGVTVMPEGLRTIGEFPNLTAALLGRGWPQGRVRKVMGQNWLDFLEEVWGA